MEDGQPAEHHLVRRCDPGSVVFRVATRAEVVAVASAANGRIDVPRRCNASVFEYQTREGDFIDFDVASAGQQATALMRVLLAQPGPPLIVDQPEDDLDTQVVQDVVERIWQAKFHRQLIFASHNANLVVNGDAELVVCCDYRIAGDQSGGKIKMVPSIWPRFVRTGRLSRHTNSVTKRPSRRNSRRANVVACR